ncbi:camphor resistance protein CrcB [Rhizobiales bacterium GAS113]|jgi:CrcB protein|nr:camphor resistance protein CrcB [Rhizobiales bacterium GAS113]SEE77486.1 camphor resistance protein CrcB [Rhizobiales bacterium GAS188]
MQLTFLVFLGAGIGGALRHLVNLGAAKALGTDFPWGTFLINISGSLVMGLIAGWLAFKVEASWSQPLRLFLTTGVLGGYTTFSAYSLDAVLLAERGAYMATSLYVVLSVGLAVAGCVLGLAVMRSLA